MEEVEKNKEEGEEERPIFRDIRRYYCEYCGICRSKKSLITSHIIKEHQVSILFLWLAVLSIFAVSFLLED